MPTHKFFVDANYRPEVVGQDEGIWGRLKSIPFIVNIPKEERDPELYDKLILEASGILNWALEGCLKWQQSGLEEPQAIIDATRSWKIEDDLYEEFFAECCEFTPEFFTPVAQMNAEFKEWAEANGHKIPVRSALDERLRRKGCDKDRCYLPDKTRPWVWKHVRLTRYAKHYKL
jgi:putative DNA primase/helicase